MTDELRGKIHATQSKTELEDLHLPYKPKRRTKGQIAIEAGLEPLLIYFERAKMILKRLGS